MGEEPTVTRRLVVLGYHKIGPPGDAWKPWFYVPETIFVEQLDALEEGGWTIVDLATALRGLSQPEALPERSALLTFDDGYRCVLERAAPILSARGYPGVMFHPVAATGSSKPFDEESGEPLEPICDWHELDELEAAGVSVESHSVHHRTFSELEPDEIVEELVVSKRELEEHLGKKVDTFAFPYGDGGKDVDQVTAALQSSGYTAAFLYDDGTVLPGVDNPYRLSRLAIGPDSDITAMIDAADRRAPA